jgi:hypothetical protein
MDQELKNIHTKLDKLMSFLAKNMLTKQELKDLRDELPTRADYAHLQSSVDGIAKEFKDTDEELQIATERTLRMEAWIKKAANKIGVEYRP